MQITIAINGKKYTRLVDPDTTLYTFVRDCGCYSVKCGCETTNCGLCTVWMDGTPVLSCSVLAARAAGHEITRWRVYWRNPKNLPISSLQRAQSSAASAPPALS